MPNTLIKRSFNGADVVLKGYANVLPTMHANDLDATRLLAHVVFFSKDITFCEFAHQNGLLPFTFISLYFQLLINVGFSFDEEQDVCE